MHVGQLLVVSCLVLGTDAFYVIIRRFTDKSLFHDSPAVASFSKGSTWQSALAPDLPSDFPVARMRRLELNPLPNALDDSVNK